MQPGRTPRPVMSPDITVLIMDNPERTLGTPGRTVISPAQAWRRAGDAEPIIGVTVVVPVAVGRAGVPGIVVPGTAAINAIATGGCPGPDDGSNHPSSKIAWRKRHVFA